MAQTMQMMTVGGEVLDTITLTDGGQLTYATGRARSAFESLLRSRPDATARELFDLRAGSSNGYITYQLI